MSQLRSFFCFLACACVAFPLALRPKVEFSSRFSRVFSELAVPESFCLKKTKAKEIKSRVDGIDEALGAFETILSQPHPQIFRSVTTDSFLERPAEPTRDVDTNSWAIVSLDERVAVLETLVATNSQKVCSHDEQLFIGAESIIEHNSNAIVTLDLRVENNNFDSDIMTLSTEIFRGSSSFGDIEALGDALPGCHFEHGGNLYTADWSIDGSHLAIAGDEVSSVGVRVFEFSESLETLTELTGCRKDANMDPVRSASWHPSGSYIAIGGFDDGASYTRIRAYKFNGTTLTEMSSCAINPGADVWEVQWHPTKDFLAVVGKNFSDGSDVRVYEFDDVAESLANLTGCAKNHGANLLCCDWSHDGNYLAVGGNIGTGGATMRVYEFDSVAKTLTVLPGCDTAFDVRLRMVRWYGSGKHLFAGSREHHLQVYDFDGSNCTEAEGALFTTDDDVEDLDVSGDGCCVFVAARDGGGNNLYGLCFDGEDLHEIEDATLRQGTGDDLRSVSIRPGEMYLVAAGDVGSSVDLEVYPIRYENQLVGHPIYDNSWALLANHSSILAGYFACEAQSNSLVSLDERVTANSDAIAAHSSSIIQLSNFPKVNSNAVFAHSWSIANVDDLLTADSVAIVDADDALESHSWAIVCLDEREKADSAAIAAHSSSVMDLDYLEDANSSALIAHSWAILDLDRQIVENSWAIVSRDDACLSVQTDVGDNSSAILALTDHSGEHEQLVSDNSWAVLGLADRADVMEGYCIPCCSDAILAHSWSIANLSERFGVNSSAVVAHSSSIPHLDELVCANSSAIVKLNTFNANSWSILSLEDRTDEVEVLAAAASDVLVAQSWSLAPLDELEKANSSVVASLMEWRPGALEMMTNNSWAFVDLYERIAGGANNSWAISTLDERLDSSESVVSSNSDALVSHSGSIVDLDVRVIENSWSILSLDERLDAVEEDVVENSWALVAFDEEINCCDMDLSSASHAIVAQSWALAGLNERNESDSSAVLAHSRSVPNLNDLVVENSWAVPAFNEGIPLLSPSIEENSWAILALADDWIEYEEKIVDNSWAIAALDDVVTDVVDVMLANSSAIVAHSASIDHLGNLIVSNSFAILANSDAIFVGSNDGKINGLESALPGCHFEHGEDVYRSVWSPDGNYIALCGTVASDVRLRVLEFSEVTEGLTELTGCRKYVGAWTVKALSWHPTGGYLSVCSDTYEYLQTYKFDGITLTQMPGCTKTCSCFPHELSWHPSGDFLAVGGKNFVGLEDVKVYEFDDVTETLSVLSGCDKNHGGTFFTLDWSNDGQYLAACGIKGTGGYSVRVYEFDDVAKTLTAITGCNLTFSYDVNVVRWDPQVEKLYVGHEGKQVSVYAFDGSNLTVYPDALFTADDDIEDLAVSADGNFVFAAAQDGAGNNLFGLEFDGQYLTEISAATLQQGANGNLRSVSLRSGDAFLVAAGDDGTDVQLEVYPVTRELGFGKSLIRDNSWAIVSADGIVQPYHNASLANSWSVVNLDDRVTGASNALVAHSSAVVHFDTLKKTNSFSLVAQSWALVSLDSSLLSNSSAIVAAQSIVVAHSWSIICLDEREIVNSAAIAAHSSSIVTIAGLARANSDAIVAHSGSLAGLDPLVEDNSWAIVAQDGRMDAVELGFEDNSWAILSIQEQVDELGAYLVDDNSWAILKLDERADAVEPIVWANSNALVTHSGSIVFLDGLERANSSAMLVHSNSFIWIDALAKANSSAIVELSVFFANSWSILALEDRTDEVEVLTSATSHVLVAHSWSILTSDEFEIANSNAIVNLNSWSDGAQVFMNDNSWAIAVMDEQLVDNSCGILHLDDRLVYLDENITDNSHAIVAHSGAILSLPVLINQNEAAYQAIDQYLDDIDIEGKIVDNSWAIVSLCENCNCCYEGMSANSSAIVSESWALVSLDELEKSNSAAIHSNSWGIANIETLSEDNSWAIADLDLGIVNLAPGSSDNSWAILSIDEEEIGLAQDNSWAILATGDSIVDFELDIAANSNAVVAHSVSLANLDALNVSNSQAIITNSQAVFYGQLLHLGEALPNCSISHGADQRCCQWSPDGHYLAIVGNPASGIVGRVFEYDELNDTLTELPECQLSPLFNFVSYACWHPTGDYLVIAGSSACSYEVRAYSFDGSALTEMTGCRVETGDIVREACWWHPSGNFLAIAGEDFDDGDDVRVYEFDSVAQTLTDLPGCGKFHGADLLCLDWSPDGSLLAVGGDDGVSSATIRVYEFDEVEKRLYEISGCSVNFDSSVWSVLWHPSSKYLFVSSFSRNIRGYRFDGLTLTNIPACEFAANDVPTEMLWNDDGRFMFVSKYDGPTDINILGFEFDFRAETLTELPSMRVSQGTYNAYSLCLRGCQRRLAVVGDTHGSVNGKVYPVIYDSLIRDNSWATLTFDSLISPYVDACEAQSWSVAALDDCVLSASNSVVAHSGSIAHLARISETTSYALVAGSGAIKTCQDRLRCNSDAIVAVQSALVAHSWSLVNLGEREMADSAAIVAHSSWAVSIDDLEDADSSAIIAHSWAISCLDNLVDNNSWAILFRTNEVDVVESDIFENSWVILSLEDRADQVIDGVFGNSWAVLKLKDRVDSAETDIVSNSSSVFAHSWSVPYISERLVPNSDALVAQSWAIIGLVDLVNANSSAIVVLNTFNANSWTILSLESRTDVVEELTASASDALIAHSGSILAIDELEKANSNVLVGFYPLANESLVLISSNSSAVVNLDSIMSGNSRGVAHLDYRLFDAEENIASESSALVVHSWSIANLDDRVIPNSWAVLAVNDNFSASSYQSDIIANSWAVATLNGWLTSLDDRVAGSSAALLGHSGSILNLGECQNVNSAAILTHSSSVTHFSAVVSDNSWAILNIASDVGLSEQVVSANSVAVLVLNARLDEFVANSNALVSLNSDFAAIEASIVGNSDALIAQSNSIEHLDKLNEDNSWAILAASDSILVPLNYGAVLGLGDALPGCYFDHGADINSVRWSPDGWFLMIGGASSSNVNLRIFRISDEKTALVELPSCSMDAHLSPLYSISWHPSGNFISIGGVRISPLIIDGRTYAFNGSLLGEMTGCVLTSGTIRDLAWHPGGNFLAIVGENFVSFEDLKVYEFDEEAETLTARAGCNKLHGNGLLCLDWSPDGQYLAVGGETGSGSATIRIYEFDSSAKTLTVLSGCNVDFDTTVRSIRWAPNGQWLFAGSAENNVCVYAFDGSNLTVYSSALFSAGNDIEDLAVSADGAYVFAATRTGGGNNLVGLEFNEQTLSEIAGFSLEQGTDDDLRSVSLRDGDDLLAAGGDYTGSVDLEGYQLEHDTPTAFISLVKADSNVNVELGDGISVAINGIEENSWAIVHISENLDIAEANSSAIVSLDARLEAQEPVAMANSFALIANSNAIVWNYDLMVGTSDALVAQKWSIACLEGLGQANSSAVTTNSWAIWNSYLGNVADASSIISHSSVLVANSSAIAFLDGLALGNSNAIVTQDSEIDSASEQDTSEEEGSIATLDHSTAHLHFLDSSITLSYDLMLCDLHKLYFEENVVLDGAGHKIRFAKYDSEVFLVSDNKQVTLKNVLLQRFRSNKISLGSSASVKFDDGVLIELAGDDDLTWTLSFIGNATLHGAGNILDLSGGGRLEVLSGGELVLQNAVVTGVFGTNLLCGDSSSSIKLSNAGLIITEQLNFVDGFMTFDGECEFRGGGVFCYQSDQQSSILAQSKLRLGNSTTFSYDPSNSSKTLLAFADSTSRLELDNAILKVCLGGLQLTKGTIALIKTSQVECDSLDHDTGLTIGDGTVANNLFIDIYPGASIDVRAGAFNYQNDES